MIALKATRISFVPTRHALFQPRRLANTKISILCLCKSNDSESEAPPPQGDTRKQDLLARIVMLQAEKIRLTEYLDERSSYLTQFAEEARAEIDKIGEDALKGIDEAGARIMDDIESQMQSFEESAELNRMEIEKSENELADFKAQLVKERNEGLFFKNLGHRAPVDKAKAKEETDKIKDLTKAKAGSKTRKNIYLALIVLLVIAIAESFVTSPDWRKVAVLGAILVGLITQFSYEQSLSSEVERIEKEKPEKEKK